MFTQILQEVKSFDRIIIHRHTNPDGDAIGSAVATVLYLRERGIDATLLSPDGIPARLAFLAEGVPMTEDTPRDRDGGCRLACSGGGGCRPP